ncbi:hypothetical protein Tco_1309308 [Tanacetum coccineum]
MEKNSRPSLENDVQEMMKHRKRARLIPRTQLEDLPMELIHHIKSVKEAARTCFYAWSTPNLSNNIPIQSFDLGITISNREIASLSENWIHHVSNPKTRLKELSLEIVVLMDLLITLPLEIFSVKTSNSPSVSQGTTSKAVVQPDLTHLPERLRKGSRFLIDGTAGNIWYRSIVFCV